MASKNLIDIALRLSKQLGANHNKFMGTKTNITFLGKGPKDDLLFQQDLNVESLGLLPLSKILPQIESSMGYLTGGKLNDIQATKLISNLEKIKEFNFPTVKANITDLASGTGNLTPGGLEYLRLTGRAGKKVGEEAAEVGPEIKQFNEDFAARVADDNQTVFGLKDYDTAGMSDIKKRIIQLEEKLGRLDGSAPGFRERAKPLVDEIEALQLQLKNKTPLMSRVENQMENIKSTSSKLDDAMKEYENIYKSADDLPPPGSRGGADDIAAPVQQYSNEIDALETMVTNRAGNEFITAYVDDIYKNAGAVSSVDVPKKRASARMFLNSMLKKETDLLPPGKGGTLESVVSEADYKFITEGGGGALGDPLVLVKKYSGDEIARRLPLDTRTEVIDTFVDNVRFTKDRAGFPNDDPRFNPDDIPEFKHGGLAKILEV